MSTYLQFLKSLSNNPPKLVWAYGMDEFLCQLASRLYLLSYPDAKVVDVEDWPKEEFLVPTLIHGDRSKVPEGLRDREVTSVECKLGRGGGFVRYVYPDAPEVVVESLVQVCGSSYSLYWGACLMRYLGVTTGEAVEGLLDSEDTFIKVLLSGDLVRATEMLKRGSVDFDWSTLYAQVLQLGDLNVAVRVEKPLWQALKGHTQAEIKELLPYAPQYGPSEVDRKLKLAMGLEEYSYVDKRMALAALVAEW